MYQYTHFIPENVAPEGAKRIGVYRKNGDKTERVCTIPLGRLTPVEKAPLYSFGIVSDIHISQNVHVASQPIPKFDNALTFFESKGCVMCIACGDLTNGGFYRRTDENDASTTYFSDEQFTKYKEVCDKHAIPVYEICGNHESYFGMPITNNLDRLETYTGKGVLSYTVSQGNDLFILCGQPRDAAVMSDEDFTWLSDTLEANRGKRCFVFVHAYIEEDSGDPLDVRENSIFDMWGKTKTTSFMNLIRNYEKLILFHGHSHMKFQYQEYDANANYTERNRFKSVHIPSLGVPRDINFETMKSVDDQSASQAYIVDVYDDCIVLNGMDMMTKQQLPIATYKIWTNT